eukprot:2761895-Amphidinium_carterae.3
MAKKEAVGRRSGLPRLLGKELPTISRAKGDIVDIHPDADMLKKIRPGQASHVDEPLPKGPLNTGHGKRKQHRRLRATLSNALCGRDDTRLLGEGGARVAHRRATPPRP